MKKSYVPSGFIDIRFRRVGLLYRVGCGCSDPIYLSACQTMSTCVSIRHHTSAYVSTRQHTTAYVIIRQNILVCMCVVECVKVMIQGSIKLSPVAQMSHWIFVLVPKDSNAKKEIYCSEEPWRLITKFTTQKRKSKKENASFLSRQFCASLNDVIWN